MLLGVGLLPLRDRDYDFQLETAAIIKIELCIVNTNNIPGAISQNYTKKVEKFDKFLRRKLFFKGKSELTFIFLKWRTIQNT